METNNEKDNKDTNDLNSRPSHRLNASSKSNFKSGAEDMDEDEDFESADDSEAREIKNSESKKSTSHNLLSFGTGVGAPKSHNFTDFAKKATIQEVSEEINNVGGNSSVTSVVNEPVQPNKDSAES